MYIANVASAKGYSMRQTYIIAGKEYSAVSKAQALYAHRVASAPPTKYGKAAQKAARTQYHAK